MKNINIATSFYNFNVKLSTKLKKGTKFCGVNLIRCSEFGFV